MASQQDRTHQLRFLHLEAGPERCLFGSYLIGLFDCILTPTLSEHPSRVVRGSRGARTRPGVVGWVEAIPVEGRDRKAGRPLPNGACFGNVAMSGHVFPFSPSSPDLLFGSHGKSVRRSSWYLVFRTFQSVLLKKKVPGRWFTGIQLDSPTFHRLPRRM